MAQIRPSTQTATTIQYMLSGDLATRLVAIPGTPLEIKAGDEVIIGKTFLKLVVDPIS